MKQVLKKKNPQKTVDRFVYVKIRFLIFKKVKMAWGPRDTYNIIDEGGLSSLY